MTHRVPIRRAAWTGRRAVGFTLVELLVVMSIIVVLIAIGVPSVSALMESGRLPNARQTVVSAVTVARAVATEGGVPEGEGPYRGAAAAVLPRVGEAGRLIGADLHITKHTGRDSNDDPEYTAVESAAMLAMPGGTVAVGIFRDGDGLTFHAPPFAVRFNGEGVLVATPTAPGDDEQFVHYDFDDTGAADRLPSAIGVIVFALEDYRDADHAIEPGDELPVASGDAGAAGRWIRDNGVHAVFNRYAGTTMNQP